MTNANNHRDFSKAARNIPFAQIRDSIRSFATQHLNSLPFANVMVHSIIPYAAPTKSFAIGEIIFRVPAGVMQVKYWNGQGIEWLPMENYDYDATLPMRSRLMHGSGFIKLAIRESRQGQVYITWPSVEGKKIDPKTSKKVRYDEFKTANVRFGKFHSDNNSALRAQLTAFLLTYWGEFVKPDTRNRFGFREHCGNCAHMVYLPVHDGMGHDYENKANSIDTSELTQYGSRMPQWICGIHGDLADEEIVDEINEADSFEIRSYTDRETGELRWLRPDQILVKGVPVSTYKMRADGTSERCAECPFYHKNERKDDKAYQREVEQAVFEHKQAGGSIIRNEVDGKLDLKAMDIFVSRYYTDPGMTNRQAVFTKHDGGWSLGFPGEFSNPTEIMVQGTGGINVYGAPAQDWTDPQTGERHHIPSLCSTMKKDFIPTMEAYKGESADLNKLVNMIHTVCNQFSTMEPGTLDVLLSLVQTAQLEGAEPFLQDRYKRALARLAQTIADNE